MFKPLQSAKLIFDPAHQLTSCWTKVYKAFGTFRDWLCKLFENTLWNWKVNMPDSKQTPCIT